MRKFIALFAVALLAMPVYAGGLRFFFAEYGEADDDNGGVNITQAPALTNPVVAGPGATLYLWAQMIGTPTTQSWYGIGVDVRYYSNDGTITGWDFYNYGNAASTYGKRWEGVGQGALVDNGPYDAVEGNNMVRVTQGRGVNNTAIAMNNDTHFTGWLVGDRTLPKETLLGRFDFSGTGTVKLTVNSNGIYRLDAVPPLGENVYLGFGDEGEGLHGDSFNTETSIYEALITPEPTSLLLLGLGALVLRRR